MVKGTLYNEDVKVPCGRCPPCKRRRVSDWVFRLQEEDKVSSSSLFITLTYKPEKCPTTENNLMTLRHRDFQLFMKKLRLTQKTKIMYYMAGEYGEKRYRPHYHVIIFNVEDPTQIQKCWDLGEVDIGSATGASMAYCTKYIDKPKRIPLFKGDDRKKEYSQSSKGIGKSFLSLPMKRYYMSDIRRYFVVTPGGIKIAMPRYYRKLLYTEEQRKLQTQFIQLIMSDYESQEKEYLLRTYDEQLDFEAYKDAQRRNRYNNFYKLRTKRTNDEIQKQSIKKKQKL